MRRIFFLLLIAFSISAFAQNASTRSRARDLGIEVGIFPTGPLNAITDVSGVLIGQSTLIRGDNIRTGVTAIVPEVMVRKDPNWTMHRLPAAVFVGNAYGKLMGSTQIEELGEIETPILLTSTLNVPRVADALLDFMLALPYNREVRSMNPVVGETNDGYLNDIRSRPVGRDEVFAALEGAKSGPVEEGTVGAGTGTVAFGWKGGIGTSSRKLPKELGGYTTGVLVQTNYGGVLSINGAPVGRELGQYEFRNVLEPRKSGGLHTPVDNANGSVMVIIATDAPVDSRNLKRMAARAMLGLGRTGAGGSNGSGDYAIAFSTMEVSSPVKLVTNDEMSPLFLAVIEATEEAVYNSLFEAQRSQGTGTRSKRFRLTERSRFCAGTTRSGHSRPNTDFPRLTGYTIGGENRSRHSAHGGFRYRHLYPQYRAHAGQARFREPVLPHRHERKVARVGRAATQLSLHQIRRGSDRTSGLPPVSQRCQPVEVRSRSHSAHILEATSDVVPLRDDGA